MPQTGLLRIYLLFYNGLQAVGWLWTLLSLMQCYSATRFHANTTCFPNMKVPLMLFQTLGLLEIFHAASGLVRSPVLTTAMQLFSRVMIIWAVLWSILKVQTSIGVPIFVFAWSLTEVVRYSYYFFTLLGENSVPFFLQWCRYSLFLILYPLGVVGELITLYAALPHVKKSGIYSLRLPNQLNFAFDYYYALIVFMVLYIPFFPQLYCYMVNQRKKVLGRQEKSE